MKKTDDPQTATKAAPTPKFRNRYTAENQVCQAFAALGTLAGVDVDRGKGPADLDAELVAAAYQSNFGDPHFLGGPCCFNYATTTAAVDAIAAKAGVVTQGFAKYIGDRRGEESLRKAETHIALIDAAITWLKKTRRSP